MLAYSAGRRGLAGNPALPADLLDRFVAGADPELCLDLSERDDLSAGHRRALAARGGTDTVVRLVNRGLLGIEEIEAGQRDAWVTLALLDTGTAPSSWARELARNADSRVREALALAAEVPVDVLTGLARDGVVAVVVAVAASPRLSTELAAALARHPHLSVRRAVAANGGTPSAVLASLAHDGGAPPPRLCPGCDGRGGLGQTCDGHHGDALVQLECAVAGNPATAPGVVAVLADHPAMAVRWAMAHRTDLPPDAYRRLARDPVPGIRAEIAANPAVDDAPLRMLLDDPDPAVVARLAENPSISLELLERSAPGGRRPVVPRVASATLAELAELARSARPAARMLVAARPDLPAALVTRLLADPEAKVRRAIAGNPSLSPAQLRSLVDGRGSRMAAAAAGNPACPEELLTELTVRQPAGRVLRRVATHPRASAQALRACLADPAARALAARHPALPPELAVALLDDPDERVVEEAAANPALPRQAMEALLDA